MYQQLSQNTEKTEKETNSENKGSYNSPSNGYLWVS